MILVEAISSTRSCDHQMHCHSRLLSDLMKSFYATTPFENASRFLTNQWLLNHNALWRLSHISITSNMVNSTSDKSQYNTLTRWKAKVECYMEKFQKLLSSKKKKPRKSPNRNASGHSLTQPTATSDTIKVRDDHSIPCSMWTICDLWLTIRASGYSS